MLLIFVILLQNQFFVFESLSALELPQQEEPFLAKIELSDSGDKLNVLGLFINNSNSEISIEYTMKTDKISQAGTSLSTQSGKDISEPNSELILTKVGLNIDDDAQYEIVLKVFEDGELISIDSLNYTSGNH
jgi:hypothetical protein